MHPQIIDLALPDGSHTKISLFQNADATKDVVLLFPAMGIAASYYDSFAKALAQKDIAAITADLRGLGHSSVRPSAKSDFGFHEILELDYRAVIRKAHELFPHNRIFLLGHSLGGILGSLYMSKYPADLHGLILIAACNIHYTGWSGFAKWKTLVATQAFAKIAGTLGYFPGHRLGFGGKGAARVIKDWSYTARTGNYKVLLNNFDFECNLQKVEKPVLAFSFAKDALAPQKAIEKLLGKFNTKANVTRHHFTTIGDSNKHYSHYNWVRSNEEVVGQIGQWLGLNLR